MHDRSTPPHKKRLKPNTKCLMFRRSMWRKRALESALSLATWPTGKPGREECRAEVIKCIDEVRNWFREPRAALVIRAVERRAVAAFRRN